MTTAFLFSGQGAEEPRMGLALAAAYPEAAEVLTWCSELLGQDLHRLLRRGGSWLNHTDIVQPVMVAVGLMASRALQGHGISPTLCAGHSVGELAAWSATGAVPAHAAIALAQHRGKAMGEIARAHPGGLLALNISPNDTEKYLEGTVVLAAVNGPKQVVASGLLPELTALQQRVGGRFVQQIGAWHNPIMASAVSGFQHEAAAIEAQPTDSLFVSNRDGSTSANGAHIPRLLAEQLTHPVRWDKVTQTLLEQGVTRVICLGVSRVMQGLLRGTLPESVTVVPFTEPKHLEAIENA